MSGVNLFRHYSQAENRYTNGLISILKISSKVDKNILQKFSQIVDILVSNGMSFKVLREYEGTADAEIFDNESVILIETKIFSGTLRKEQIERHLNCLKEYKQKNKMLILLTPDSENSHYIQQFTNISATNIKHISWKSIIELLEDSKPNDVVLTNLISDYIDEIKEDIFEQDISAVIVKINFSDESGVYEDEYLDEFKGGEWADWHTPKRYNELDGKGKKLILYDKYKGLVLEVEIGKVRRDPQRGANNPFPWSNKFAKNTLEIYTQPIPLDLILKIPPTNKDKNKSKNDGKGHGFCNFNNSQTPKWNLTREQYEWLTCRTENEK